MKNRIFIYLSILALILSIIACNFSTNNTSTDSDLPQSSEPEAAGVNNIPQDDQAAEENNGLVEPTEVGLEKTSEIISILVDPEKRIQPSDLIYQGAFRLPEPSGGSDWDYSGHALTHYPNGDANGPDDGFPGSLYGAGHDQQLYVSEITIPEPIISPNLESLNTAETLQPFSDISDGIFVAEEMAIPRLGLAYLPPQASQSTEKIHFVWGQHIQDFELSHGWAELDLSNPQPAGPWLFDGFTNYVTSDYLFDIPKQWSDEYTPGMLLATGRAREGLWSGRGPGLFAYGPWLDGNPPPPEASLASIRPLLLYGIQESGIPDIISDETMSMEGYRDADHWMGGSWLTAGEKSAVIFVGTKALGNEWYGFANGVVWEHDCAETNSCPEVPEWPYEDRGFWAEDYESQIIFYDTSELAAVALGQLETWKPQPYAILSLQDILFEPELNLGEYKRDLLGAAAFDRDNGLLYIIERLADEYRSVIHVWRVISDGSS